MKTAVTPVRSISSIGKNIEVKFFTKDGIDVTSRIHSGRTKFFECILEAGRYASQNKTYHYPLFNSCNEIVGYGCPK